MATAAGTTEGPYKPSLKGFSEPLSAGWVLPGRRCLTLTSLQLGLAHGGAHEGENRTSDKPIGEIVQAKRTTGHLPPHGPGARQEDVKGKVNQKPEAKKTDKF